MIISIIYFFQFVSTYFGKAGSYFSSKTSPVETIDMHKKYTNSPLGIYLYGGVGCGKTMLMDMLYDNTPIERKSRVHFHSFMLDVHKGVFVFHTFLFSFFFFQILTINSFFSNRNICS